MNQEADAVCFSHLEFNLPDGYDYVWGPDWKFNTWFVLYDVYGNKGTPLKARLSANHHEIIIQDREREEIS